MRDDSTETVTIGADEAGLRLDRVLAAHLAQLSRSRLKALIVAGHVTIAGRTIRDPAAAVKSGDMVKVSLPPPEPAVPQGEEIPLTIVYEDDAIIVIDKPKDLVVHPAAGHASGTLVNALIAHCGDSLSGIGGVKRPGIVHRLDKDTTGLMIVAKTDKAHRALAKQFAEKGEGPLRRGYLAVVWGAPGKPKGTIDAPLGRHPQARDKQAVRSNGRAAVTHWQVLERFTPPGAKTPGRQPARLHPGDRAHPPDPRASGAFGASNPRGRHIRHRIQDQGEPACSNGPRRPVSPWQTGFACLSAGY